MKDYESIDYVKNMSGITDVVTSREPELRDLLKRLLEVDPAKRWSCKQALEHDFFKKEYPREAWPEGSKNSRKRSSS